jgi:hypothetical protein
VGTRERERERLGPEQPSGESTLRSHDTAHRAVVRTLPSSIALSPCPLHRSICTSVCTSVGASLSHCKPHSPLLSLAHITAPSPLLSMHRELSCTLQHHRQSRMPKRLCMPERKPWVTAGIGTMVRALECRSSKSVADGRCAVMGILGFFCGPCGGSWGFCNLAFGSWFSW